jgi:monoamine oxidase
VGTPATRWSEWSDKDRETAYRLLNQPDGPIYLAGEHMSYVTGWQEGAILSAHEVICNLGVRVASM